MDNESPQNNAALRSNSTTSITKLAQTKKLVVRKRSSRNQSFDTPPNEGVYLHSPNSLSRPESMIITSSAHSSTTSLNSQGFSPLKANGNRPPSAYYSRDFLSSLAPREGGYAIAATMGNGLGAHGAMSVDERRRSQVPDRRAPMAKSAGMGRWSLDGGEVSPCFTYPMCIADRNSTTQDHTEHHQQQRPPPTCQLHLSTRPTFLHLSKIFISQKEHLPRTRLILSSRNNPPLPSQATHLPSRNIPTPTTSSHQKANVRLLHFPFPLPRMIAHKCHKQYLPPLPSLHLD